MSFSPVQFGKWLVLFGLLTALIGLAVIGLSKLGFFRLPGDLEFGGRHWRVFLPITTCIVVSVIVTAVLWLIRLFKD